ncbi:hypothetical protein FUAX_19120 [Fulvitalea axinellae]|uniref:Secretion system C-terminal sorting domain-containing protein n=1 Tax=Fulvitalea axinellae TaxID=1182444 RepID=A0AAU9DAV4_9BACT|nr:hypothetical protein FUAX_19120 [Fulvitalea axinellae]
MNKKTLFIFLVGLWLGLSGAHAQLLKAEYFWDVDPGQGNGTALSSKDGGFDEALETIVAKQIGLPSSEGVHMLFVRVMNKEGQWGPALQANLALENTQKPMLKYERKAFETFAGIPVTIRLSDLEVEDSDTPLGGLRVLLETGENYRLEGDVVIPDYKFEGQLSVPVRVTDGVHESNTLLVPVTVNTLPSRVIRAEYFWDDDPGEGNGTEFLAEDGAFEETVEGLLSKAALVSGEEGLRQLNIRVQDERLQWSPVFKFNVSVENKKRPMLNYEKKAFETFSGVPVVISTKDLSVKDEDTSLDALKVVLESGDNYRIEDNVVIPDYNFVGQLAVPVRVTDGQHESNTLIVPVTVRTLPSRVVKVEYFWDEDPGEGNGIEFLAEDGTFEEAVEGILAETADMPAEEGLRQLNLRVLDERLQWGPVFKFNVSVENKKRPMLIYEKKAFETFAGIPVVVNIEDLSVKDEDTDMDALTVILDDGENYRVEGNVVIPDYNFVGQLAVPVRVSDGVYESNTLTVPVKIKPLPSRVVRAEYFWDKDPGEGKGVPIDATDMDIEESFEEMVAKKVIIPAGMGIHQLNFRIQDELLNWGPIFKVNVSMVDKARPFLKFERKVFETYAGIPIPIDIKDLNVEDEDSDTNDHEVVLGKGKGYSVQGNIVTPDYAFEGTLMVPVQVSDGVNVSNELLVPVQVKPLPSRLIQAEYFWNNDPGEGNGNQLVTTDDGFDESFEKIKKQAATVPSENGIHLLNIRFRDGREHWGPVMTTVVVVGEVEDHVGGKPVITGLTKPLRLPVNQPKEIQLNDFTVYDSDNTYPNGFGLEILDGENYTVKGTTLVPSGGFTGVLTAYAQVNDGANDSEPFPFSVEVFDPVPKIMGTKGRLITNENTSLTFQLSDLIVEDGDNEFPDGFSLSIVEGENYSATGKRMTPSPDYVGNLQVGLKVSDGQYESDVYQASVEVRDVIEPNEIPVITGTRRLLVFKVGSSIDISLDDLLVTDTDNDYPTDFSLQLLNGANCSIAGNRIVPDEGFEGDLLVPVIVNDGTSDSAPYWLSIRSAENLPTVMITGVNKSFSTKEETGLSFLFSDLQVEDETGTYPAGFSMVVKQGENYTATNQGIIPAKDFNGTLEVDVKVSKGEVESEWYTLPVQVTPINDLPVIAGPAREFGVEEDGSLTLQKSDLIVSDPDNNYPTDFSLTVMPGSNYTGQGTKISPVADFSGTLEVPVKVNDGELDSEPFVLSVSVSPLNDRPVITAQTHELTMEEDGGLTLQKSDLTVSDPDNNYPTDFSLTVLPGSNYTVQGAKISPVTDFSGTLEVPVKVNDGELDSEPFALSVSVSPLNDRPVITAQAHELTMEEDGGLTLQKSDLIVSDPDNNYPTDFSLTVMPGSNYTAQGTKISPVADFSGTLEVPVKVNDGELDSEPFVLSVSVSPLNDLPNIIGSTRKFVMEEDGSLTLHKGDLIVSDPDNSYPVDFSLTVISGQNYTVQGTTVLPAANFNGALKVPVKVSDGIGESKPLILAMEVVAVNDAPVISGTTKEFSIFKGESVILRLEDLNVFDPDNTYPEEFSFSIGDGENYKVSGAKISPVIGFTGLLSVPVRVHDGNEFSQPFIVGIEVLEIKNQVPIITGLVSPLTTNKNSSIDLKLGDFVIEDDNSSEDLMLTLLNGNNYNVEGTKLTPAKGFEGMLFVRVQVNDGTVDSEVFSFELEVVNNDIILGGPIRDKMVRVYPNPFDQELKIWLSDLLKNQLVQLKVCDMSGKEIFSKQWVPNANEIVIRNRDWSSGIYLLQVSAENSHYQLKLIKE